MTPNTAYVLGEIEHLLFCGARPEYICEALNKTSTAIEKMCYRHNRADLARPFANNRKGK